MFEAAAIVAAGCAAGIVNAIVGSGTLISFPTLIAFGYPPVLANVSNTTGLVFGNAASIVAWRRELEGQTGRALRLGIASVAGGVTGAVLLFELPASAFRRVVPVLIALSVVLVTVQPLISKGLARQRRGRATAGHPWAAASALFLIGVYGGYFGAAQGLLIIAVLGVAVSDTLHRQTALRNVLAGATNAVAAVAFMAATPIAWGAVVLIAAGSILGGWVGVRMGRRLPPGAYRAVIALVGVAAIAKLLV
ncbi:MAG: sulfite exporter TauE/SafE family protein [Gaiellaceae bacterium]